MTLLGGFFKSFPWNRFYRVLFEKWLKSVTKRHRKTSPRSDSNRRPTAYKAVALPAELRGQGRKGDQRDSNPQPSGPQPDALPIELWSPHLYRYYTALLAAGQMARAEGALCVARGGRRRFRAPTQHDDRGAHNDAKCRHNLCRGDAADQPGVGTERLDQQPPQSIEDQI